MNVVNVTILISVCVYVAPVCINSVSLYIFHTLHGKFCVHVLNFRDGTTDVTRTFHFGTPRPIEIVRCQWQIILVIEIWCIQ